MKKFLMTFVCLMTMVVGANAQNLIVDELKETNKVVSRKYDRLVLDPNKSIKDNYAKIDSLMSLHKENTYDTYVIVISGHYNTNKAYRDCILPDYSVGHIKVKNENININKRWIDRQIIEVLTQLYAHSLDKPFNVSLKEQRTIQVNKTEVDVETGRSYKHQNGNVSKEYKKTEIGRNTMYYLHPSSLLFKKIYNKVMAETGLKDEVEKIDDGLGYNLRELTIDSLCIKNEVKIQVNKTDVDVETGRSYKHQNDNVPKELKKEKGKRKKNKQEGDGVYYQLEK